MNNKNHWIVKVGEGTAYFDVVSEFTFSVFVEEDVSCDNTYRISCFYDIEDMLRRNKCILNIKRWVLGIGYKQVFSAVS